MFIERDENVANIEICCIFNKQSILNDFLIESLKGQTTDYKLTTYSGDKSPVGAANIYNRLVSASKAEVIICCHQDVRLESKDTLTKIYDYLHVNDNCIIGAAGAVLDNGNKIVYGNVVEGKNKSFRMKHIDQPIEVLSLDECLIAFNRKVFDKVQMDDKTCTGWHLYAADMCYAGRDKGVKSYAFPMDIWHLSPGEIRNDFFDQLKRVCKKYKSRGLNSFVATCANYNCSMPVNIYIALKKFRWRWSLT